MLLTAVAFMFAVSDKLPSLPYLAFVDKYIFAQFVFIFAIMVMVTINEDYDSVRYDDDTTETIFVCIWIGQMLGFVLYGVYLRRAEMAHVRKKSDPFAKLEKLESMGNI